MRGVEAGDAWRRKKTSFSSAKNRLSRLFHLSGFRYHGMVVEDTDFRSDFREQAAEGTETSDSQQAGHAKCQIGIQRMKRGKAKKTSPDRSVGLSGPLRFLQY